MRAYPLHDLLALPRDRAVERHRDGRNWRVVKWPFFGFAVMALVLILVSLARGSVVSSLVSALDLAALVAAWIARRQPWFDDAFRAVVVSLVAAQVVTLLVVATGEGALIPVGVLLAPYFLLRLRLRPAETALIAALTIGGLVAKAWMAPASLSSEDAQGMTIGGGIVTTLAAAVGMGLSRRDRQRFLLDWRLESAREREQSRLRGELDDARKVQLAMLPGRPPQLDWLELDGLSLPASEVGGDYYDYFVLPDGRLAVVVGDVAGHGLASGMLLAGVRSCLHLLRDELGEPLPVIAKLDRVVRDAGLERMFMSLILAVVEPERGALRLVSAGHPPALLCRADGTSELLGDGAPPLGTRLPAAWTERRAELAPGDVLLLYSDGLTESADGTGERFGDERLARALARAIAATTTTRDVQAALLGELAKFKGDAEQADDITLLVLRRR